MAPARPTGDVTERRLREQELREAERRISDILENVQLLAVLRDAAGEACSRAPLDRERATALLAAEAARRG